MESGALPASGPTALARAGGWFASTRDWPGIAAFGVIYGLTAKFGLDHSTLANNVTLIWPPSGISLFVVMRFGYRWWPGIVVGDLIGNASTQAPLAAVLGISVGNLLSALLCAALLARHFELRHTLARTRDVLALIVLGSALSALSATVGPASLALAGVITWALYPSVWLQWWMGDATGVVVLAPLLLAWWQPLPGGRNRRHVLEAVTLGLIVLAVGMAVFGGTGVVREGYYPGALALFPLAVWAALRFGMRGASALTLAVSSFAVWGTVSGHGPFAVTGEMESLIRWWVFVNVISVTSLLLAVSRQEREQAQSALRSERDFVATVLDTEAAIVLVLDREGRILRGNRALQALSGQALSELSGQCFSATLIAPEHRAKADAHDEILRLKLSNLARFEADLLPRTGGRRHIAWSSTALRESSGAIRHRIVTGIDVTEQRHASLDLRHARRDLEERVRERTAELARAYADLEGEVAERRRLEREILFAAEHEQRRIGHELHDSLGQKLTAAAFLTEVLSSQLMEQDPALADQAARIGGVLGDSISETRRLARGLAPVDLDAEGLRTALGSLAETAQALLKVPCEFEGAHSVLVHDRVAATHLFRIAQEAVNNAVKHSAARHLHIALRQRADGLVLSVTDDGVGMPEGRAELEVPADPASAVRSGSPQDAGMGLSTMRYRARAIGAELSISSSPDRGVRVEVRLPVNDAPDTSHGLAVAEETHAVRQRSHC